MAPIWMMRIGTHISLCAVHQNEPTVPSDIPVKQHKSHFFKKSFVQCTKRSQQQPGELDIPVCTKRYRGNSQSLKQLQAKTFG